MSVNPQGRRPAARALTDRSDQHRFLWVGEISFRTAQMATNRAPAWLLYYRWFLLVRVMGIACNLSTRAVRPGSLRRPTIQRDGAGRGNDVALAPFIASR